MAEIGFYAASRGYWQTTDAPPADIAASYPADTIEVPLRPSARHELQNGAWVLPPLTQPEVDAALEEQRNGMTLTFAQLLIGLVTEGWITEQQGDAWSDGVLPAPVNALIASLPNEQRFAARVRAKRPSVVERNNDLVKGLGLLQGKTPSQIDVFFETYAAY